MRKKSIITFMYCLLMLALLTGSTAVPTAEAAESEQAWCNGPDVMTVLVVGTDSRYRSYESGLADSIMVYRIDFETPEVTVLSVPRDMWVYIPGVEDDIGVDHAKLNTAYLYGAWGYHPDLEKGSALMKMTFEENWGLKIDHAAAMNMVIFADVIRAIGGIEVYNPSPVYSFKRNKPMFPTGGYFFDGKDAQLYARWRDPRNDLDRVDRHSIIVKAIIESLFDLETVPHMPQLLSAYLKNVETDLSLAQLSQLLCLATKREQVKVTFTRIPEEDLVGTRTYFAPLKGEVFNWVEKEEGRITEIMTLFQEGDWPPENGE